MKGGGEGFQIPPKTYIICTTVLEVLEGHPYEGFGHLSLNKTGQSTKQFGVAGLHR